MKTHTLNSDCLVYYTAVFNGGKNCCFKYKLLRNTLLDSTLVEGQLGADSESQRHGSDGREAAMQSRIEHKTTNGPLDRHEGPPLYGKLLVLTLVTETNNEACAQLQLALVPLSQHASHTSQLSILRWSISN